MARICVTGASGRAGRAVVAELVEHGHWVVATDLVAPAEDLGIPVLRADLTDYGQALEVLQGVEAVVHLANIPAPGIRTPAVTFTANMTMNFNVFHGRGRARPAPGGLGIQRDHARPSVRRAAALRPGRRGSLSGADHDLCAVQGGQRDDCRAHRPVVRASRSSRCASRTSSGRVDYQEFPVVLGRTRSCGNGTCGATSTSGTPRPACRLALDADRSRAAAELHHRRRRHGDEPSVGRSDARGLPRRAADRRRSAGPSPCWRSPGPGRSWASPAHSWRDHVRE